MVTESVAGTLRQRFLKAFDDLIGTLRRESDEIRRSQVSTPERGQDPVNERHRGATANVFRVGSCFSRLPLPLCLRHENGFELKDELQLLVGYLRNHVVRHVPPPKRVVFPMRVEQSPSGSLQVAVGLFCRYSIAVVQAAKCRGQ
jgi:hypothetical protein